MKAINQYYYYVLGQLAYSIARANEQIDHKEKKRLKEILVEETQDHDLDFDYEEVISLIFQKEKRDFKSTYNWAMSTLKTEKKILSDEYKTECIRIIRRVVSTFPPNVISKQKLLTQFQKDLANI